MFWFASSESIWLLFAYATSFSSAPRICACSSSTRWERNSLVLVFVSFFFSRFERTKVWATQLTTLAATSGSPC